MGQLQLFPFSFWCKSDHTLLNRNNLEKLFLWQPRRLLEHDSSSLPCRRTRITHLTFLLLPLNLNLHSHSHSLPFRHHTFLPCPAFCPVFRPCSSPLSSPMSSLTPNSTPHSSYSSSADANSVTYRVVIKGRVQGVFYRDWTVQNATELGLAGWVRNRKDGSVEALFSGPADKVQEMQQRCRSGPPAAIVTGFEASPSNEDPGSGFERRRTV